MNKTRQIAFGFSTRCNIKCEHCVAAHDGSPEMKMQTQAAIDIIDEFFHAKVTGISFTAGEPLLYLKEMKELVRRCQKHHIYSRIVTNGYWGNTEDTSDQMVATLKDCGLSQLRISFSRWHQKNVSRNNILNAALSCGKICSRLFHILCYGFQKGRRRTGTVSSGQPPEIFSGTSHLFRQRNKTRPTPGFHRLPRPPMPHEPLPVTGTGHVRLL